MFKKSDSSSANFGSVGANASDCEYINPDFAHSESSPMKRAPSDKKGLPATLGASIRIKG
jgi:hypothetical protein